MLLVRVFVCILLIAEAITDVDVESASNDLLSVAVVYRHGDRNPAGPGTYPNDPYGGERYYPTGWGQLTTEGINRHIKLGKWFRNRYNGFLPLLYNVRDISVRSTTIDRALMSAEANLNGLYPIRQHIPIHTVAIEDEHLLAVGSCPALNQLLGAAFNSVDQENQDLYRYVSLHSGANLTSLTTATSVFDAVYIQKRFGLPTPTWIIPVYDRLEQLYIQMFALYGGSPERSRLTAGLFLNNLVQNFQQKLDNTSDTYQRFQVFSAHDLTLAVILTAVGLTPDELVFYSDSLIFELRKNGNVNLLYRHEGKLLKLTIPGCSFDCPLSKLIQILSKVLITEEELLRECQIENNVELPAHMDILRTLGLKN